MRSITDTEYLHKKAYEAIWHLRRRLGVSHGEDRAIIIAATLLALKSNPEIRDSTEPMSIKDLATKINDTLSTLQDPLDLKQNHPLYSLYTQASWGTCELTPDKEADSVSKYLAPLVEYVEHIENTEWAGDDVIAPAFIESLRGSKSSLGQVFTPPHIAHFIAETLDITAKDKTLDACNGTGILTQAAMTHTSGLPTSSYAVEYSPIVYAIAKAGQTLTGHPYMIIEGDSSSEPVKHWIQGRGISRVIMNPPYENTHGCLRIVRNVLESVPAGTVCAFILPSHKLDRATTKFKNWLLQNNQITQILSFPLETFWRLRIQTSVFYITAGTPQGDQPIRVHAMTDDGLVTVPRKGRYDTDKLWETQYRQHWLDVVAGRKEDETTTYQNPDETIEGPRYMPIVEPDHDMYRHDLKRYHDFIDNEQAYNDVEHCKVKGFEGDREAVIKKMEAAPRKLFRVGELFNANLGGYEIMKRDQVPGTIRHVTNSLINNGVSAHVGNEDMVVASENEITIAQSGSVGADCVFFQPAPYSPTERLVRLTSIGFDLDPAVGVYMTTAFRRFMGKYNYGYQPNPKYISRDVVSLPVDATGAPDWGLVRDYMRALSG
jgi:predicted RNA methylase